jgi:hypothetical protein
MQATLVQAHESSNKLFFKNISPMLFTFFKQRVKPVTNDAREFRVLKKCYIVHKILGLLCFLWTATSARNIIKYCLEVRNRNLTREFGINFIVVIFD